MILYDSNYSSSLKLTLFPQIWSFFSLIDAALFIFIYSKLNPVIHFEAHKLVTSAQQMQLLLKLSRNP